MLNALSLGLIAALAWGFHDFAVRLSSRDNPLMSTLLSVLFIGGIFHLGFIAVGGELRPITPPAIWLSVGAGVSFLMASASLYVAFKRGPVKLVAPIIGSYPILSLLLATINGGASSVWQWLAVVAVVAGIGVLAISSQDDDVQFKPMPTILISLAAAIGFAVTFEIGQIAASMADEGLTILITRSVSFILLLGIMLVRKMPILPHRQLLPTLVFMGMMDALALFCVLSAGTMADAKFASVGSSVFGMVTVLLSWIFLREKLNLIQWCGCVTVFIGIGYLAL